MSEPNELTQLRAEKKALDALMGRHFGSTPLAAIHADVAYQIEQLEAVQTDPWRDEKTISQQWLDYKSNTDEFAVAQYIRHLEAENAKQAARIAELESRPIPPLDPKRVIATACKVLRDTDYRFAAIIMQMYQAGNAGIYPLAGDDV